MLSTLFDCYLMIRKKKLVYELIIEDTFERIINKIMVYINYIHKYKKLFINKFSLFFIIILLIKYISKNNQNYNLLNNENFIQIEKDLNLTFYKPIRKKINLGIYAYGIKNGGRARCTALLLNYLDKIKVFNLYLFTRKLKEENEYIVPEKIKRILVNDNLINEIKKNRIDILIYQLSFQDEIKMLNNLNFIKVIFYQHLGIFDWIYGNYSIFKSIYKEYINSKYIINIIPYENDYIFKKWGISSILMNNFMTYDFKRIIPSNLSSDKILMIGRGDAKKKRFRIGIQAMEYINKELPKIQLIIVSDLIGTYKLQALINNLNLEENIKFLGYSSSPEIFFKNTSLNLFPSISEAFPLVLSETKIYGIPNILLGLDYTSISKGGTVIINDETPETFAKEAIKILKSDKYKYELGDKARISMKQFNNDILLIKWIKLIISIYNGDKHYEELRRQSKGLSELENRNIIENQIRLLKIRLPIFKNITIRDFENFSFMEKFTIIN